MDTNEIYNFETLMYEVGETRNLDFYTKLQKLKSVIFPKEVLGRLSKLYCGLDNKDAVDSYVASYGSDLVAGKHPFIWDLQGFIENELFVLSSCKIGKKETYAEVNFDNEEITFVLAAPFCKDSKFNYKF